MTPARLAESIAADRAQRGIRTRTWTLTHPARPLTVNKERTMHYQTRATAVREWRGVFHLLALEARLPHCAAITVHVDQELRNRAHIPDIGACFPSVKAAIDGLVDAGVIDDDDPVHLPLLAFAAPHVTGRDALTLTITEARPRGTTPAPRSLR